GATADRSTFPRKPTLGCCGSLDIFQYAATLGSAAPYVVVETIRPSSISSIAATPAPSLNAQPATGKLPDALAPIVGVSIQANAGVAHALLVAAPASVNKRKRLRP